MFLLFICSIFAGCDFSLEVRFSIFHQILNLFYEFSFVVFLLVLLILTIFNFFKSSCSFSCDWCRFGWGLNWFGLFTEICEIGHGFWDLGICDNEVDGYCKIDEGSWHYDDKGVDFLVNFQSLHISLDYSPSR